MPVHGSPHASLSLASFSPQLTCTRLLLCLWCLGPCVCVPLLTDQRLSFCASSRPKVLAGCAAQCPRIHPCRPDPRGTSAGAMFAGAFACVRTACSFRMRWYGGCCGCGCLNDSIRGFHRGCDGLILLAVFRVGAVCRSWKDFRTPRTPTWRRQTWTRCKPAQRSLWWVLGVVFSSLWWVALLPPPHPSIAIVVVDSTLRSTRRMVP
jgi:hypothetical protein